jgi:tripartite-type tricarboxylate transporter receptor subunit TctC
MLEVRAIGLAVTISALILGAHPRPAEGQSYPSKSVTVVVPYLRLGLADIIGHLISTRLTERLKQSFVVENHPGSDGNLGARMVAGAVPDGYTLLVTTTALAVNATASKNRAFEISDLRPVAIAAYSPFVIAINPSNSAKNLKEFIANAEIKSFNYGGTPGTPAELHADYFFNHIAKVKYVNVPFQSADLAITAAIENRVDAIAQVLGLIEMHIRNGKLRGVGVSSEKRNSAIPAVPTYSEAGFSSFSSGHWVGIFAPARTPDSIVAKLNAEINAVMKEPFSLGILRKGDLEPLMKNIAETDAYFKSELVQWGTMVRATGFSN